MTDGLPALLVTGLRSVTQRPKLPLRDCRGTPSRKAPPAPRAEKRQFASRGTGKNGIAIILPGDSTGEPVREAGASHETLRSRSA